MMAGECWEVSSKSFSTLSTSVRRIKEKGRGGKGRGGEGREGRGGEGRRGKGGQELERKERGGDTSMMRVQKGWGDAKRGGAMHSTFSGLSRRHLLQVGKKLLQG